MLKKILRNLEANFESYIGFSPSECVFSNVRRGVDGFMQAVTAGSDIADLTSDGIVINDNKLVRSAIAEMIFVKTDFCGDINAHFVPQLPAQLILAALDKRS